MKTNILKTVTAILIISILSPLSLMAKKEDFSKPTKKEFEINKGATLNVDCEFTDIKALNWNKDIISVEVMVTVDAKSKDKAEDRFDNVEIDLRGNKNEVFVETNLSNSYFGNNNNNIDIEVIIYYPSHINLELDNEFGETIFEDISGKVNADISYGSFTANNLTNTALKLDAEFGKINVNRFQGGDVEVSYGGFNAEVVGVLNLESEFSSNEIEYVERLDLNSGYDKLYIGKVNTANIEMDFSSLRIDELERQLRLHTSYGSFKIKQINQDFELIDISSEFTGIKLYFAKEPSFAFKVSSEMGDFNYPKDLAHITKLEKEMFNLKMEGYFGNAKGNSPKLILNVQNAGAAIKINE